MHTQDIDAIFSASGERLDCSILSKLAFGPLTQARLWEGERAQMTLDRGPCELSGLLRLGTKLT